MISDGEKAVDDSKVLEPIDVGISLSRIFFASDSMSDAAHAVVEARINEANVKVLNLKFGLSFII